MDKRIQDDCIPSAKMIHKYKKLGFSMNQIVAIQKSIKDLEKVYTEKSFVLMLALPLQYMLSDVWQSDEEAMIKAKEFLNVMIGLYKSYENDELTLDMLSDLIKKYCDVDVVADWLKGKNDKERD